MGVLRRINDSEPRSVCETNPDVPAWVASIIQRMLAKRREDRYQTAGEVAELLERCLAHVQHPTAIPLPVVVPRACTTGNSRRWPRKAALIVASTVLAGTLLVAAHRVMLPDRAATAQLPADHLQSQVMPQDQASPTDDALKQGKSMAVVEVQSWDGVEARLLAIEQDLRRLEESFDIQISAKH